ncbi:hypothetical protein ACNFBT_11050 [Pseudomonas sp. NY15181]|uniref:hypothetical protein n=1 Tax=Pseudomonas sp. NY15181 TaxID=3400349 RepID=UPI003A8A2EB9
MANRSKKVVLSARVEPYLKAALELYATSTNEKIVKVLERFIETCLSDAQIENPLNGYKKGYFMTIFTAIWSEDEVIFNLRAGLMGSKFSSDRLFHLAMTVVGDHRFKGDFDLFGDLNGMAERFEFVQPYEAKIDLGLVRSEWDVLVAYVDFLENNKPFCPTYDDYKRMREQSESK